MLQRIVISFFSSRAGSPQGSLYLDRALALKKRANALGATLCAWSAQSFSFDFDADELEEALALAALAREGSPGEQLSAGAAEGAMSPLSEGNAFAALSWGPALLVAESLARDAKAGEVLLAPSLVEARERDILALGWTMVSGGSGRHVLGVCTAPPPTSTPLSFAPPRLSPTISIPPPVSFPVPPPRMPTPPRLPVTRFPPPPLLPSAHPGGPPAAVPPSSTRPVSSVETPRSAPTPSLVPSRLTLSPPSELRELAKRALVQGDLTALDPLLEQLRSTGEHADLVDRMTGLVALRRGATTDALRRLRESAESATEPRQAARARLAYGVALASAGRMEGALLEVLLALARAREAADAHGEHACALFLARLAVAAGHPAAAPAWAQVASKCARELAGAG